jgi:hypothetical protein
MPNTPITLKQGFANHSLKSRTAAECDTVEDQSQTTEERIKKSPRTEDQLRERVTSHDTSSNQSTRQTDKIDETRNDVNPQTVRYITDTIAHNKKEAQIDTAVETVDRSVRDESSLEGATALRTELETLSPEMRSNVLSELDQRNTLNHLAVNIKDLNREETALAIEELAHSTDLVGPLNAELITDPIAEVIADGGMEQTGSDANGGVGGMFRGANTHNSEREFVDGITSLEESPGAQLFNDSLTNSLMGEAQRSEGARADRARGMAGAASTGNSDLVPDDGLWTQARNLAQGTLDTIDSAAQRFEDARTGAHNNAIEHSLDLSDKIEALEPGDTVTMSVNGEISAQYDISAGGAISVTMNSDGTYTVKGSADLMVGPGGKGGRRGSDSSASVAQHWS